MSKERKSKLKPYADRLDQWFGVEGLTIQEVQEKLWQDCSLRVSSGHLSEWWEERSRKQVQEKLLGQIASGAQQCKEVEKEFGRNPSAELETLIKVHRVLILKLATQANVQPELLELVTEMMKPVLEFAKLQEKKADRELDRDKFEFNAAKVCLLKLPELKRLASDASLDNDARIAAARKIVFGEAAK